MEEREEREYEPKHRNSRKVLISSSLLSKRLYRLKYASGRGERRRKRG